MKIRFYIIDTAFDLQKCVISTRSGWNRHFREKYFCYGEFPSKIVYMNAYALFFLINEIACCPRYRKDFGRFVRSLNVSLVLRLEPVKREPLDYKWGAMTSQTVWEAIELDHIMSWLSTLGGAFSALGDYDVARADTAGKVSIQQLRLAMRIGDPVTIARCKLYWAISLIQKFEFRAAKALIREQYWFALSQSEANKVLVNMCLGIWSKLKYTRSLYRQGKTLKDVVVVPDPINGKAR